MDKNRQSNDGQRNQLAALQNLTQRKVILKALGSGERVEPLLWEPLPENQEFDPTIKGLKIALMRRKYQKLLSADILSGELPFRDGSSAGGGREAGSRFSTSGFDVESGRTFPHLGSGTPPQGDPAEGGINTGRYRMKNLTVLIGDHDEIHIDLCSELIREACGDFRGVKVLTTMYGEELLELARTNSVDLVVLYLNNIAFPGLQFDVQARLSQLWPIVRQLKKELGKPIIGISGVAECERAALDAGIDHFFSAPYRIEGFQLVVQKCLGTEVS